MRFLDEVMFIKIIRYILSKSANKRYNTKYLKIQQIQNTMIYTDSDAYNKTIRRFSAWMTL